MKVKIYIHARPTEKYNPTTGNFDKSWGYEAWSTKSEHFGVFVSEHEIDVPEVDEKELVTGTVKILRDKQQQVRAERESELNQIEEQIQQLLCIEDKSGVSA